MEAPAKPLPRGRGRGTPVLTAGQGEVPGKVQAHRAIDGIYRRFETGLGFDGDLTATRSPASGGRGTPRTGGGSPRGRLRLRQRG